MRIPSRSRFGFGVIDGYPSDSAYLTAVGSSPKRGDTYFNTTSQRYRYWDGDEWQELSPKAFTSVRLIDHTFAAVPSGPQTIDGVSTNPNDIVILANFDDGAYRVQAGLWTPEAVFPAGSLPGEGDSAYIREGTVYGDSLQWYDGSSWRLLTILSEGTAANQVPFWNGTRYLPNPDFLAQANVLTTRDNAVADASQAQGLSVRGGDKTAGTGDGGDVGLIGGSSVGGQQGRIEIDALATNFADKSVLPATPVLGDWLLYNGRFQYWDSTMWQLIYPLPTGTVTNSILAWDGANWVEDPFLTISGTSIRPPDDTVADAFQPTALFVTGAFKSAGTGDGGDVKVAGGNSFGGLKGRVVLQGHKLMFDAQLAADPMITPLETEVYYNNVEKRFKYYDGTVWRPLGSGGGAFVINYIDTTSLTLPTVAPFSPDGTPVVTGDLVLFKSLTAPGDDDRVYKATVVGLTVSWTLQIFGQSPTSVPTDGDSVYVRSGTVNADTLWFYDGLDWYNYGGNFANRSLSNLTAPTAINQDLLFGTAINGKLATADNLAGSSTNLELLTGTSVGALSGQIFIASGNNDFVTGGVTMVSGDGDLASGPVFIGSGGSSTGSTGSLNLGTGNGDSSSGQTFVYTGSAANGPTGSLNVFTGQASGGGNDSGTMLITSGDSTNAASGQVSLKTGNASTTSGNIIIQTGTGASRGSVNLNGSQINVTGHVIPTLDVAYDLGSASLKWKDLYLSGATVFLGTLASISGTTFKTTDVGAAVSQPYTIRTGNNSHSGATGVLTLKSGDNGAGGGSGAVSLSSGNVAAGGNASGSVSISSGGNSGGTGNISISSGGSGGSSSGNISLTTGTNNGGQPSGTISLTTGTGAGPRGNVNLGANLVRVTESDLVYAYSSGRGFYIENAPAATAGGALSVLAGSSGAGTNLNGGILTLASGGGTGSGSSRMEFQIVPTGQATGTAGRSPQNAARLTSNDVNQPEFRVLQPLAGNNNYGFLNTISVGANSTNTAGAGLAFSVDGGDANGTDLTGGNMVIRTGRSTGNAGSPTFTVQGSAPGSSGTALQARTSMIDHTGANVTLRNPNQSGFGVNFFIANGEMRMSRTSGGSLLITSSGNYVFEGGGTLSCGSTFSATTSVSAGTTLNANTDLFLGVAPNRTEFRAHQVFTIANNQVAPAVVFSVSQTTYKSQIIEYEIDRNGETEFGTILMAHNGTVTTISYPNINTASVGVTFTADLSGGNMRLLYTSDNTASGTMRYHVRRMAR